MKKYMPYGMDLRFQYSTYKNIGKSDRIEFKARKNFICKARDYIRKKRNKNEKRYKNFNTFSQWENSICEEICTNRRFDKEDLVHYLKHYKRTEETSCEMIGAIVTPIYIVMLTMGTTLCMNANMPDINGYVKMSFVLLLTLIFLMLMFRRIKTHINFYKDLIMIVDKEKTNR